MLIITRRLWMPDVKTSSSRSASLYAESLPLRAFAGFFGASCGQLAVVWMTDAPAALSSWRLSARVADQRKVGSSKKPIVILGAAWTVAAGATMSTSSASSARRVGFSTGRSSYWGPWAGEPRDRSALSCASCKEVVHEALGASDRALARLWRGSVGVYEPCHRLVRDDGRVALRKARPQCRPPTLAGPARARCRRRKHQPALSAFACTLLRLRHRRERRATCTCRECVRHHFGGGSGIPARSARVALDVDIRRRGRADGDRSVGRTVIVTAHRSRCLSGVRVGALRVPRDADEADAAQRRAGHDRAGSRDRRANAIRRTRARAADRDPAGRAVARAPLARRRVCRG